MATIRLRYHEAEDGYLPRVCLRCGEPAEQFVRKTFAHAPEHHISPLFAMFDVKRMTIRVPFCSDHLNHWSVRTLSTWISFAILIMMVIISVAFMWITGELERTASSTPRFGSICLGITVFLGLCWLVAVLIMQATAIRATDVSHSSITLTGVCRTFIEALEDYRELQHPSDEPPYSHQSYPKF